MMIVGLLGLDIGKMVQGSLTVVGAAVVGGLVCGIMLALVAKALWAKATPKPMMNITRGLGGITTGLITSMYVFNGGGGFGPGGPGSAPSGDPTITTAVETKSTTPAAPPIRIAMLGGAQVKAGGFYLVQGETTPRTLEGLDPVIKETKLIVIQLGPDSVARDHAAVKDLEERAATRGIAVKLELSPGAP